MVKLVIENMTVPSSVTLPPTSFVVSVAMLGIWVKTAPIGNEVLIGGIMVRACARALVEEMPSTGKWR